MTMDVMLPGPFWSLLWTQSKWLYFSSSVHTTDAHVLDCHPPPYHPFLECLSLQCQANNDPWLSSLKAGEGTLLSLFVCVCSYLRKTGRTGCLTPSISGGWYSCPIIFLSLLRRGRSKWKGTSRRNFIPFTILNQCLKCPLTIRELGQNHWVSGEAI